MPRDITIRQATPADLPALGRLGALLMRTHYDVDVIIYVAERDNEVIGYVYAGLEPISWKELRDACGFIHDVVVDESARRNGTATALIEKAIEWLGERGAPRVMLWTAERNAAAQQLFARLGFRRTMIEMTREL